MHRTSAFNLAIQVEQMRNAQKLAEKFTGTGNDHMNSIGRNLESLAADHARIVDQSIKEIYEETTVLALVDKDAAIDICRNVLIETRLFLMGHFINDEPKSLRPIYKMLADAIDISEGKEPQS